YNHREASQCINTIQETHMHRPSRLLRQGMWIIAACLSFPAVSRAQSGSVPVPAGEPLPVQPPLPVWPSDYETSTGPRPVFRSVGRCQATTYRVELARDAEFITPIVLERYEIVDPGGITPAIAAPCEGEPLADGRYYWRAFAGNDE